MRGDNAPPLSLFRWINPLENQAYSNNPQGGGRANPVLPLDLQNALTESGLLLSSDDDKLPDTGRVSTQTIDVKQQRVINVVSLPLPSFLSLQKSSSSTPLTLTVRVNFTPHAPDPRRINVKFDSFAIGRKFLDLPLGILGPTGWLRTTYIDDDMRITRGHKGSVFVLRRPQRGQ